MKLNGIDSTKIKTFYFEGNIDTLEEIEQAMKIEGINTNKVNVINITTSIFNDGECEEVESYHFDTLKISYNYYIYYILED